VPQRFSYYAAKLNQSVLLYDEDADTFGGQVPSFAARSVISYGSLFRDDAAGDASAVWRPGVRTLRTQRQDQNAAGSRNANGPAESFCQDFPGGAIFSGLLDALALDDSGTSGGGNIDPCAAGSIHPSRAAGLVAATRSGFRDGFEEMLECGRSDADSINFSACDYNAKAQDRRGANVLPLNFDLNAFQEALGDTTGGELGSFFCPPGTPTCSAFMGRPFNGIVYIGTPYPGDPDRPSSSVTTDARYRDPAFGSERGYAANGGIDTPERPRVPRQNNPNHMDPPVGDPGTTAAPDIATAWAGPLPILTDSAGHANANRRELRDDEVAALPVTLCSDDLTGTPNGKLSTKGWTFLRPICPKRRTEDVLATRINGVRIINARRVNSNAAPVVAPDVAGAGAIPAFPTQPTLSAAAVGQLPDGISIITNMPTYVVGDVNISSDAFNSDLTRPWVPVLIGGDVVHPLSNFWDDARSRWGVSAASRVLSTQSPSGQVRTSGGNAVNEAAAGRQRPAMVTRYYMQMLSGWGMTVPGSPSGGIHNFPRFLEDWGDGGTSNCKGTSGFSNGCPAIILGSLVIGHNRVYTQWGFLDGNGDIGRAPPRRDWGFDRHLEDLTKQPPGAPVFDVAAIQQWTRN
jgi:hypothetical protein